MQNGYPDRKTMNFLAKFSFDLKQQYQVWPGTKLVMTSTSSVDAEECSPLSIFSRNSLSNELVNAIATESLGCHDII